MASKIKNNLNIQKKVNRQFLKMIVILGSLDEMGKNIIIFPKKCKVE